MKLLSGIYSTNMLVVAAFGKCVFKVSYWCSEYSHQKCFSGGGQNYICHIWGNASIPVCVCVYVRAPAPPCDITPRGTRPWSAQWAGEPAVMTHAANKYTSCKEGLMKESQRPEAVCPRRSSVIPPPWLIRVLHTGPLYNCVGLIVRKWRGSNAPLLYVIV